MPVQEIVGHGQVVVGVGGVAELPRRLGRNAVRLHQLGHGVDAARQAARHQLGVDAWAAVAGLDLGVDRPDLDEQAVAALLGAVTGRSRQA